MAETSEMMIAFADRTLSAESIRQVAKTVEETLPSSADVSTQWEKRLAGRKPPLTQSGYS